MSQLKPNSLSPFSTNERENGDMNHDHIPRPLFSQTTFWFSLMVRFCFSVGVLFPKVQTFAVVLFPCLYCAILLYSMLCQRAWWCSLGVLCCVSWSHILCFRDLGVDFSLSVGGWIDLVS